MTCCGLLTDLSATFTVPDSPGSRLATFALIGVPEPFSDSEFAVELSQSFAQRIAVLIPLVSILMNPKPVKLYILY